MNLTTQCPSADGEIKCGVFIWWDIIQPQKVVINTTMCMGYGNILPSEGN